VFFYAVLGGMKGITYTQVAQYCVLIFAFMVPAIFISILLTGNADPADRLRRDTLAGGRRDASPNGRDRLPARQARTASTKSSASPPTRERAASR
jgi:Na+(H+)/acetate symporter ActP